MIKLCCWRSNHPAHNPPSPPFRDPPSPVSRRHAYQVVTTAGQAALVILGNAAYAAYQMSTTINSPTDDDLGRRAVLVLTHRDFMQAVADASRGMTATTALLRSQAGARQLLAPFDLPTATKQQVSMASTAAEAVCRYARIVTDLLVFRPQGGGAGSGGAGPRPASSVPADTRAACGALAESQLLAASAGAVLDDPGVGELPEAASRNVCLEMDKAAHNCGRAVLSVHLLSSATAQCGAHEGQRLAEGLLRALRHREVQRLQVALLDQLAVHAGMGAGLVVDDQGEQQGGQQEGQQACGWEGSSGTWWLAREEQRQGKVLGSGPRGGDGSGERDSEMHGRTAGWLEDVHCHVLCGTLLEWESVPAQLAGQAGVEARPPPLLVARLAARAAEALCRLCRGRGLGGAYAPAPTWELAKAQVGVEQHPKVVKVQLASHHPNPSLKRLPVPLCFAVLLCCRGSQAPRPLEGARQLSISTWDTECIKVYLEYLCVVPAGNYARHGTRPHGSRPAACCHGTCLPAVLAGGGRLGGGAAGGRSGGGHGATARRAAPAGVPSQLHRTTGEPRSVSTVELVTPMRIRR